MNPSDPEDIASAITWVLEHEEEAAEMGQRGREAVLRRYNWANEADKLLAFYDRFAAKANGRMARSDNGNRRDRL